MSIATDDTKVTVVPATIPPSEEGQSSDSETVIITWDGDNDPKNPINWPPWKKSAVTGIGLFATFIALMNGTIITPAHYAIDRQFDINEASFPNSYWMITSWGVGGALSSLVVLPVMEDFGIRYVFLAVYLIYICFLIPTGVAQNFATLIITRFFSGGCVAILANTVAGIISNIYVGNRARTVPLSMYITIYLASSSMGPVIGASVYQFLSWRWIGYLQLIWTGIFFPIFVFALPETRGSAILKARAQKLRKEGRKAYTQEELETTSIVQVVWNSVQRPLYMLCTESVVFVSTIWSAFSIGTICLFTQSAAWTSYPSIPWIAPAIGLAMVGAGCTCVIVSNANYLIDAYSMYAASAVGAIGLGENMFVAFLPLAAQSMYTNLGSHWASSLLGLVSLVLAFAPVAVFVWGKEIRARSPYIREAAEEERRNVVGSAVGMNV
ncbi:MFS general substrate transporter [Aspergillus vadensis CBS 113365]|uniref:MFS general substrate transporter n=1 Tax=Aspergillus vadensis (strain CBS 113365 / IMI 142717 / IBT 24658) TaxID=1448311 RepID=A0A319B8K0_ASPVC|nr:MFS general substrate transporter [Aspergillus vadensis CBS 113365]PYH68885.1 MFS general substrate transporter [Aspergillus vadensis CBS 113365]